MFYICSHTALLRETASCPVPSKPFRPPPLAAELFTNAPDMSAEPNAQVLPWSNSRFWQVDHRIVYQEIVIVSMNVRSVAAQAAKSSRHVQAADEPASDISTNYSQLGASTKRCVDQDAIPTVLLGISVGIVEVRARSNRQTRRES